MASSSFQLIENHGIIGNMRSAALVALDGTLDFLCYPRFDSPTVFAALLDPEKGGAFRIVPDMEVRCKQMYLPDTNILLTRMLSDEGVAEITDFMPVLDDGRDPAYAHQVIRSVRVVKGSIRFKVHCSPRFDYARARHEACKDDQGICFRPEDTDCSAMALYATVPLETDGRDAWAEFTLNQGENASFAFGAVAEEQTSATENLKDEMVDACFNASADYWRKWIRQSVYKGRWRETVNRSALALKLLTSSEYGSNLAAVTFGLPEQIGGGRNWDYRYVWLRDASFSLYALIRLGLAGEVQAFTRWMRSRLIDGLQSDYAANGPLRIMYRSDGGSDLEEQQLHSLAGYRGSQPVRVGNQANEQLQLDIYGEIMDAFYLSNKYADAVSKDGWHRAIRIMEWLTANWRRPDQGIWEMRAAPKQFLHSRLMCWVAFDRVIRLADKRSLDAPVAEWRETRRAIDEDILNNFWDEELDSFVQAQGEKEVDASLLLMPMLRYISPTDPRWLSTMKRIEDELSEDCLVFRYKPGSDGLPGGEGSFTACSFWLIECLARAGQVEKARLRFDKMLGYANHLGLYSEQLGSSGGHLGNFPQALTHLALISAATYLDRALDGKKDVWA